MLFLLFQIGEGHFVLEAKSIVEVLPLVEIRPINSAPRGVVGTLNYHGAFIPVVDLSKLMLGRPAMPRLSTRIILVQSSRDGEARLLGLIAESATETLNLDPSDFVDPGMVDDNMPFLGAIAQPPSGLVQQILIDRLLPATAANVDGERVD